jgi:DNA-directed RNA polymerase subunit RPC12/RpoP
MSYKCTQCGRKIPKIEGFVRCPYCGSRILIKDRPNISKEVSTD